jgi:hypothetical protein
MYTTNSSHEKTPAGIILHYEESDSIRELLEVKCAELGLDYLATDDHEDIVAKAREHAGKVLGLICDLESDGLESTTIHDIMSAVSSKISILFMSGATMEHIQKVVELTKGLQSGKGSDSVKGVRKGTIENSIVLDEFLKGIVTKAAQVSAGKA